MAAAGTKRSAKKAANDETLSVLASIFNDSLRSGQSKHVRIRHAILDAIVEGHLKHGDQVPPEQDLCSVLSVSLGTVQRALRELSIDGTLVRVHGRGTYVAEPGLPNDEIWQFRFRRLGDESLLPVASVVLEESTVEGPGRWQDALGEDPLGYLKIIRIVSVTDILDCYNELYFRLSRFGRLSEIALPQLRNVNIKTILAREFNAPTLSITQHARASELPDYACEHLELPTGTFGMEVDVTGHSYGKEAIFLQRIMFPQGDCYMDLTHEETRPLTAGGATVSENPGESGRLVGSR